MHELVGDGAVDAARQLLDRVPAGVRAGHLARDAERADDVGGVGAALRRELGHERRPERVGDEVGVHGGDQLAPQRVLGEQVAEALDHGVGEVGAQVVLQPRVLAQVGGEQVARDRALGVGEQQRELGALQPAAGAAALGDLLGARQPLGAAVEQSARLERAHQVLVGVHPVAGDRDLLGEDLRLQEAVVEHVRDDVVGDRQQQLVARRPVELAAPLGQPEQDLQVDLVVGAVDPGRVVDEVGVDQPAAGGELDARAAREAEVAALADRAAAQVGGVDADRVRGAVLRVVVGLVGRLDHGADAAVEEQVDRGAEDRADHVRGRHPLLLDAERGARLLRQRDRLRRARPDAAALRDPRAVVVVPARAGQLEQPLALGEPGRRIRIGVDEHVPVVVGGDEPDLLGEQHPVAEHVARHVADPDDRERVGGGVEAELGQVALDRLPRAARGDPERLVVVAGGAAGRERVAEPEAALLADPVRGVRERRRALVGGDHQVGVVVVVDADALGVDDPVLDAVVGQVEQPADVAHVLALDLGLELVAVRRRPLQVEAALGPGGHDHGVLGQLGAHQSEDLGPVVLPVRPADAAAGDRSAAQVDALHRRAVHVDLEQRGRLRDRRHVGGAQLERRHLAVGVEGVRPQRGVDQQQLVAQDPVVVERRDRVQAGEDLLAQGLLGGLVGRAVRIEPLLEVAHERGGDLGVGREHVVLVAPA